MQSFLKAKGGDAILTHFIQIYNTEFIDSRSCYTILDISEFFASELVVIILSWSIFIAS